MNTARDRIAALSAELGSVGGLKRLRAEAERITYQLTGTHQFRLQELYEIKQSLDTIGAALFDLQRAVAAHLRAIGVERVNVG
jgi:hypothetical protein